MAIIGVLKETYLGEKRTALTPDDTKRLCKLGFKVICETNVGQSINYSDDLYQAAGADIAADAQAVCASADILLRLRKPTLTEIDFMREGTLLISYLDPFFSPDITSRLTEKRINAIAMELIPRTTRAQKMDALSSQASLAGYAAVILAAERTTKVLPMMTTPAGTINPARVFIIGAGVAGLQAIATAKRLGARVDAFDTRPAVAEQVRSLGARFVEVDLGETGQTKDGYAKTLTEEQLQKQRDVMAKQCAMSDIVITTAQVFGRKAPIIITKEMVAQMKPGSIIVDLAVDTGGNTEGAQLGKEVDVNGVTIIGMENMPGKVAVHASQVYSANLYNLIEDIWDKDKSELKLNDDDEIINGCLLVHHGVVRRQF